MLQDRFGRSIDYLRLSVTDRCDLRCVYCMPKGYREFEEPEGWLSFDEIARVVEAFARLGVGRVRLTGGEPLLRRGLPELAARLSALPGIDDLSLSTNATQLAQHARALREAGVRRLNVSLDSLDRQAMERITGRDVLPDILAGLEVARREGFVPLKINMVVMPGVNEEEVEAMVEYCRANDFTLRLIETMPMGDTGRQTGWVDLQPIRHRLRERYGLVDGVAFGAGPARYLQSPDGSFRVGFITPLSQHFCETCNRVRLNVDGSLHLCLGQDDHVALRPLLRAGAGVEALMASIREAIDRKPERHDFTEQPCKIIRVMSRTGG